MISIILPTYNEVQNITKVIDDIENHMSAYDYEIIVADDSSTDGTIQTVKELTKSRDRISLIVRTSDHGLVQSISEGIKRARYDIILWMDADGTMKAETIPVMIEEIKNGVDIVMGSRYIPGGGIKGCEKDSRKNSPGHIFSNIITSEDSLLSVILSAFGNKFLNLLLIKDIHDYSSGFFAVKKHVFNDIRLIGNSVDYCISFPVHSFRHGFKIKEIPMILSTRRYGQSKTSNSLSCIIKICFQCLIKAIRLRLSYTKIIAKYF